MNDDIKIIEEKAYSYKLSAGMGMSVLNTLHRFGQD
jgi:hypothetical protein